MFSIINPVEACTYANEARENAKLAVKVFRFARESTDKNVKLGLLLAAKGYYLDSVASYASALKPDHVPQKLERSMKLKMLNILMFRLPRIERQISRAHKI